MKTIGFIGAYDKTDIIIYVSKVLTKCSKKILIIDSTATQKAKYIVPAINPTLSYITNFEDIDIAVGFKNIAEIKDYSGIAENKDLPYDILLIDIDSEKELEEFEIEKCDNNFFVTGFDIYSLKKGLEIITSIDKPIKLTKVLFTKDIVKTDNEYLNFLSLGYKVEWDEERIYFFLENGDQFALAENQRVQRIKFKNISTDYKNSIAIICSKILQEKSEANVRKIIKQLERSA